MAVERSGIGWGFWFLWAVAHMVGFAVVVLAGNPILEEIAFVLVGIAAGIVVGIVEWLVLRRWVARAEAWVLGSTLGFLVGVALGWSTGIPLRSEFSDGVAAGAGVAVFGVVFGAITALTLVWLPRRPLPN